MWIKIESVLELTERRHNEEIKGMAYTIWRLKHQLRSGKRVENELNQMKTGSLWPSATLENARTINGKPV